MSLFETPDQRLRRLSQSLLRSQARSENLRNQSAELSAAERLRVATKNQRERITAVQQYRETPFEQRGTFKTIRQSLLQGDPTLAAQIGAVDEAERQRMRTTAQPLTAELIPAPAAAAAAPSVPVSREETIAGRGPARLTPPILTTLGEAEQLSRQRASLAPLLQAPTFVPGFERGLERIRQVPVAGPSLATGIEAATSPIGIATGVAAPALTLRSLAGQVAAGTLGGVAEEAGAPRGIRTAAELAGAVAGPIAAPSIERALPRAAASARQALENQQILDVYRAPMAGNEGFAPAGSAFTTDRELAETIASQRGTQVEQYRIPANQLTQKEWYLQSSSEQRPVSGIGRLATEAGGTRLPEEPPLRNEPGQIEPPAPPQEPPAGSVPPESSWEEARDKALAALKSSKKVTAEQTTRLSAERSKRIAAYKSLVAKNRAEGMAPREAERVARGALGGEVEKVAGLKVEFTEPETEALFRRINDFDYGTEPFMQPRAAVAMEKLITETPLQTNEINVLRRVFGDEFGTALEKASKGGKRGWDEVFDLIVLPKTVLSSFDLSYPFRQGIMVAPRHPSEFFGNIPNMAKSFASEEAATKIDDAIKSDPTRILMKQADGTLQETSQGAINQNIGIIRPFATGQRSAAEEGFLSQLGLKIPGVRQSSRAFVTYGNKLRSDLAKYWIEHWQNTGVDITPERLESLGNLLNRLTGRGTLGRGEAANRVTQLLQATWWSPQYRLSGPQAYAQLFNKDPEIRKIAAQNLAAFVGGGVGILGLLKATGAADVDVDPRSTDFGKIRVGNFRANFWGSQQLLARSIAQAVTQQKYDVGLGGVKHIKPGKVVMDYFRSGLAPEWSLIWDALQGENYIGQEFKLDADEALDRLFPIALQDTIEAYQAGGPLAAGATFPLSTLGLSTTTYLVDLSNQLQAIGQYRGIDPKLEDELQSRGGFYDRVEAYQKSMLAETRVKPTVAMGILKVARDEGRDTNFIQTALKLRQGTKTEIALRNPEWLKFIADNYEQLKSERPELVDPEQGAPDYIIRYLNIKGVIGPKTRAQ